MQQRAGLCPEDASLDEQRSMSTQSQLRDKLRKIEALFAGAGTPGERDAAEAALGRVRAKLGEMENKEPPIELQTSTPRPRRSGSEQSRRPAARSPASLDPST